MPVTTPRSIAITLAEDTTASSADSFAVLHRVDEHDCLAFCAALRRRGHVVYYINWRDIDIAAGKVARAFDSNRGVYVRDIACEHFDLAFVYKMEGFLREQQRFFDMVSVFERCCRKVVNAPATIRANIDKGYLFELAAHGAPVIPSYRLASTRAAGESESCDAFEMLIRELHASGKSAVLKPLRAERGDGIVRLDAAEHADAWRAALATIAVDRYLAQEFMPSVRAGERSLAYLGHAFQHAVIKHPNPRDPREFRCNESLGGTVAAYMPTRRELDTAAHILTICERLGWPVHFSRIDLLDSPAGPVLMEAELLNPSVFANYIGRGDAFGAALAEYLEALLR